MSMAMTLADLPLLRPARIRSFRSLDAAERCRLGALGLREGALIKKLLPTPLRDPIECLVGAQLLAIEAWLLALIEVDPA